MIITKTRLKQIIKEELEKVRLEQIEITNEEQINEGPLKKLLTSLAVAGSLFGAAKAKADPMEIEMHHRISGEHYKQTIDIPGAKAGMDKFELQRLAQNYIDDAIESFSEKARAAGKEPTLQIADFTVDKVTPVAQSATSQGGSQAGAATVSYDSEREVYKVVVPKKDSNNQTKIFAALGKHLNKKLIDYKGSMFTEKGPTPDTVTVLIDKAGVK
jgi:hypothetical protein